MPWAWAQAHFSRLLTGASLETRKTTSTTLFGVGDAQIEGALSQTLR